MIEIGVKRSQFNACLLGVGSRQGVHEFNPGIGFPKFERAQDSVFVPNLDSAKSQHCREATRGIANGEMVVRPGGLG